ncbi:hypothetical protein FHW36_10417 [Chitinophaga polysaccharea]|uniref:Uncharacterized protein n=1 Tax=Chitinophaga polysaccharea TaxID=1293035 RepID=A0A561PQD1_9BACT|nr:hypothetical protein [Chitinophaga polysaccharea]TWF40335.1 hypothetical protein FHW36_10417 [Chitinophaga polysaccharea]
MRYLLWLPLMFGMALQVKGQVSMTVQLPPAGILQKTQLWNIVLVSVSERPENVRVMLRLSDLRTNQPLLTGISRNITLNKGARLLQMQDVEPVQYEYISRIVDPGVNGFFTAGNYLACYSIVAEVADKKATVGEDCVSFTVEPASPALLNMPANGSILETTLPQFSWLPPAPVSIFNDLNYDLTLVEMKPSQSAAEAVQQNIPVYRSNYNKYLFANYPASAPRLDTGKQYAWTITVRNGAQLAGQTEVWTFRLKGLPMKQAENESAYLQLKKELDASIVTSGGNTLHFNYRNEPGDSVVTCEVLALDNNSVLVFKNTLAVRPGENLIRLPLGGKTHLEEGRHYLLRLTNSRREYWYLQFIYSKPENRGN